MYRLVPSAKFERKARKLLRNNARLKEAFDKTVRQLAKDPFYSGLKTHRVDVEGQKEAFQLDRDRGLGVFRSSHGFAQAITQLTVLHC